MGLLSMVIGAVSHGLIVKICDAAAPTVRSLRVDAETGGDRAVLDYVCFTSSEAINRRAP